MSVLSLLYYTTRPVPVCLYLNVLKQKSLRTLLSGPLLFGKAPLIDILTVMRLPSLLLRLNTAFFSTPGQPVLPACLPCRGCGSWAVRGTIQGSLLPSDPPGSRRETVAFSSFGEQEL